MRIYDTGFAAHLAAARDGSLAPIWFFHVVARDHETGAAVPISVWSGDEDITLTVQAADGSNVSRLFTGNVGLSVTGLKYVADLTDNPVTVSLSQIAPVAQLMARGYDLRLAYCEIHASAWAGGGLASTPQLQWVGIVDEGPIATPAAGNDGGINLMVRSEIMAQLTAINPAKSSDEHQRRRQGGDSFCRYSGVIGSREIQWFKD